MQNICTPYSVKAINLYYAPLHNSIYLCCLVHLSTLENSLRKRYSHAAWLQISILPEEMLLIFLWHSWICMFAFYFHHNTLMHNRLSSGVEFTA